MSSDDSVNLLEPGTGNLIDLFPEAKLTMRDRLPLNFILTNAVITIQKSILNIKYSSEEIKEAVQGFVAMIPDQLKDQKFNEEMEAARQIVIEDVRPEFCGTKATAEWCESRGLPTIQRTETFDYFKVFHACFNLLQRAHMLLKTQPKEIFTGHRARTGAGEEPEYEQSEADEL